MQKKYIIECRDERGKLDFTGKQPERIFGRAVWDGIDEDAMAKTIFRFAPDAKLSGMNIPDWPRHIDPRWVARVKTW